MFITFAYQPKLPPSKFRFLKNSVSLLINIRPNIGRVDVISLTKIYLLSVSDVRYIKYAPLFLMFLKRPCHVATQVYQEDIPGGTVDEELLTIF